jgi:hypothetical protein
MTTGEKDGAGEMAEIVRDLENLERRYGALEDSVRYLKLSFVAFVIGLVALALWGAFIGNGGLSLVALALLALCALAALVGPFSVSPGLRGARWIDVVGWEPPGVLGVSVKRSEAMAIEYMIAHRRRRLALLQQKPSRPLPPPQSPSGAAC